MNMQSAFRRAAMLSLGLGFILSAGSVVAQTNVIWTNSAGTNAITAVDKTTGALLKQFNPGKGNGRGMVVVGNTVYYSVAGSGNVFKLDATTGADLGVAFTVPGATGLSTIAYDGTNFWIGDYSGTKNAYYVSPAGALLKTISLANCSSFCDGLEYFNGKLISNRGDTLNPADYDVYDTNGVLLQAAFIHTTHAGRGIAYDGTNFFIADASQIYVYNGTTGAFIRSFTPGGTGQNFEDLSTDYAQRVDTGGSVESKIPTLNEWALIALALMLAAFAGRTLLQRRS